MLHWLVLTGIALSVLTSDAFPARAAEARLPVTADNSIAAYHSEVSFNAGGKSVLRVKGIQHLLVFRFDLERIRGWRVRGARLYLHPAREHRLRTVGLSTIAADWAEGTGAETAVEGGSCFTHAVYPTRRWAGEQSDFTDVSFGAGETLYAFDDVRPAPEGWLEVPVPACLVAAMQAGASYGLAVSDEKGQTAWNNDVHSREQSQFAPYLVVEGEPAAPAAVPPVAALSIEAAPDLATLAAGAARVRFASPSPTAGQAAPFAYAVRMREGDVPWVEVPRWRIPFAAAPGRAQEVLLPGLRPEARHEVQVTVLDSVGYESAPVAAAGLSSPKKAMPAPLARPAMPPPAASAGISALFAVPDVVKVDPVTGAVLEAPDAEAYHARNPVWNGREMHLSAARNEVVSCQVVLPLPRLSTARAGDLQGPGGRIPAGSFRLSRVWYVRDGERWCPEVALPLSVAADNAIPGQRFQAVSVELHVPKETPPGEYRGSLTLEAGGTHTLPVVMRVWGFTLPDRPGFAVDLNGYGFPAGHFGVAPHSPEGVALVHAYHRLAYEHRCVLNLLPYGQSGRMEPGGAPAVSGEGAAAQVGDWRDYDRHYGPLVEGTAVAGPWFAGAPLRHQYLPFHECYPLPIQAHYRHTPGTTAYPEVVLRHAMEAPPIEEAFTPGYGAAFQAVVRRFVRHFRERGWSGTEMQCYLNNKYYFRDPKQGGRGTSWWLLDEPMHRDDWRALLYYGRLFKDAVKKETRGESTNFRFRCDISRPQWVRDPEALLPLIDVVCVSGDFYRKNALCLEYQRRYGIRYIHYGTANRPGESNLNCEAWALKAYLLGADGILPWNSIGQDRHFEAAEPTALLYPGKRFGIAGPLPSLRLQALRRGAQDVEYLIALAKARGWDREQTAAAVAGLLDLTSRTETAFVDDAGRSLFGRVNADGFFALREAIGTELSW